MKLNLDTFKQSMASLIEQYQLEPSKILEIGKSGIKAGFKSDHPEFKKANLIVDFRDTGDIIVARAWEIVDNVEDEETQISLDSAKEKTGREDWSLGELVMVDITPKDLDFSRRASTIAAQTIRQNLKTIEKEKFQEVFKEKMGKLIRAKVKTIIEGGSILLETYEDSSVANGNTIILPINGQIPQKIYEEGEEIIVFLSENMGKDLIPEVSESNEAYIAALLRLVFPEVEDETIIIKKIVRQAGIRTKVLVESTNSNVDAIGTLVGKNAERIRQINQYLEYPMYTKEGGNTVGSEKIEFIEWTDDEEELIKRCFKPVEIEKVVFTKKKDKEGRDIVSVYVKGDDSQKSLAVGKKASNVKIINKILGNNRAIEIN